MSDAELKSSIELVTPEKAEKWLANAAPNRNISEGTVRRYAADMATNRWMLNGQPLIFATNGQLLDGRHRLTAIIATRCEVRMMVTRGVRQDAFKTMDAGRIRTLANTLAIDGHKNTAATSAVARMTWAYAAGTNLKYGASRPELLNLIRAHPAIEHHVALIISHDTLVRTMAVPRTALAAVLTLANEAGDQEILVARFLDGFISGEGLFGGDPRLTLRRWLERERQEAGVGGTRIAEPFFAAAARAWTAFATEEELPKIRLPVFFNRETISIHGFAPKRWGDVPDMARTSFAALGPEPLNRPGTADDPTPPAELSADRPANARRARG